MRFDGGSAAGRESLHRSAPDAGRGGADQAEPVLVEVRERRSRFGRWVKWFFFGFQLLMLGGSLGTCAAVGPFLRGPDPEVALGAGMFGAVALGTIWTAWPLGTLVLGLMVLFTRGRKRLIPVPPELPRGGAGP